MATVSLPLSNRAGQCQRNCIEAGLPILRRILLAVPGTLVATIAAIAPILRRGRSRLGEQPGSLKGPSVDFREPANVGYGPYGVCAQGVPFPRTLTVGYWLVLKPFNFLLTCHVKAFGHPHGTDPTRFHLIAPYEPQRGLMAPMAWHASRRMGTYSRNTNGIPNRSARIPTANHARGPRLECCSGGTSA